MATDINNHQIDWDSAHIMVSEDRYVQRKLMKTIIIKKAINYDIQIMIWKDEKGHCWITNFYTIFFQNVQ